MTYTEACDTTVTREEAIKEINLHHVDVKEFFVECGDKVEYAGEEVLGWLGY